VQVIDDDSSLKNFEHAKQVDARITDARVRRCRKVYAESWDSGRV